MNDSRQEHDRFEELAAGYALDALDQEDERHFRVHLLGCTRCQELVADLREVAVEFASTVGGEGPDPALRDRILAIASDDDRLFDRTSLDDRRAPVITHRSARRRTRPYFVAAAAVVALAGVTGGFLATSGGVGQPPAKCAPSTGCSQVVLTSAVSHQPVATVIVAQHSVWLRPSALPADDASRQIYVLWELVGHHAPRAVGAFDVTRGARQTIAVGTETPGSTAGAFAISLESGRQVPRTPSATMAIGRIA